MKAKVIALIVGLTLPLGAFAFISSQAEGPPREEGCYQETYSDFGGPYEGAPARGDGRTSDEVVRGRSEYSDTKLHERTSDRAVYMKTDENGRILKRVDAVRFGGENGQWVIEHSMIAVACETPTPTPA